VLSDLSGEEILARLAADTRLRTIGGLDAVLDRATEELHRDVNVALGLIDAVVQDLPSLPAASGTLVLYGRALRLRANGLRMAGEVPKARAALAESQRILARTPAGAIELEHARILEAYMLSETGERDEALQLVRQAADGYTAHGDAKGTLQARLMEGAIRFECGAFVEARTIYYDALSLAENVRDEAGRAMALGVTGQCTQELGNTKAAATYYAEALPTFDTLGMTFPRQQILWALTKLAVQEGRLTEALRNFAVAREGLLQRGMFLSAAFVALDLVEVLLDVDRNDLLIDWCAELVRTFSAAGMPPYALKALAHLQTAAEDRKLNVQVLGHVRGTMREHLQVDTR